MRERKKRKEKNQRVRNKQVYFVVTDFGLEGLNTLKYMQLMQDQSTREKSTN